LLSKEKQRKRMISKQIRYFALAKVSYIAKTQRMADVADVADVDIN
jgi:hypothetical protein